MNAPSGGGRPLARILIGASLVAVLAPLAVVAGTSYWQFRQDVGSIEAFVADEAVGASAAASNTVELTLDLVRGALRRTQAAVDEGRATKALLRAVVRDVPQIESLVVTDAAGRIVLSDRDEERRTIAALAPLAEVMAGAPLAYSDAYRSPALGEEAIAVVAPWRRGGERGGVVARISLPELNRLLAARFERSGRAVTYVTDRKGFVVAHPDPAVPPGKDLHTNPPVAAAMAGRAGSLKYESTLYGGPRIGAFRTVPGAGWIVVSVRETGDRMVDAAARFRNLLMVALLAGLLAAMAAAAFGRRLVRPLEDLAATMRRAGSHGVQDVLAPSLGRVDVPTGVEEYAVLGTSFNAMAEALDQRVEEIMALTEEVQAQNEELQAQNEELHAQGEELQAQTEEIQAQADTLALQNGDLERLSQEATAASRMKSEFLANMSHELRTPLNSIIGYTELIVHNKKYALPDRVSAHLATVLRNARNLLVLINDILDLSKVEAGKATVYVEPVALRPFAQQLVGTAEPLAREKGVALRAEVAPDLGTVLTDETKLRQIVLNLVSNAIKFTREGEVIVRFLPVDGGRVAIEVEDTGMGIPPEMHEAVFEEFRQVDGSTTREAGGTGLGLSIARKLARMLGGDLVLRRSAPGAGSLFVVTIAAGAAPGVGGQATAAAQAAPGERVVVSIDDDPEMLLLLAERLKDTPYRVVPATSGESGLQLVRDLRPYAVTVDVLMPGMDGWSVLRALKEDPASRDVPVLVLSFIDDKLLGFELGASAYLTKPVEQPDLLSALDRFAGGLRPGDGRVLVVDDDADARGIYLELLGREGIPVEATADGRTAIAEIAREAPALVILDLMMPHMDGFEVLAWMRRSPATAGIPVIVVTGKTLTDEDHARLRDVKRLIPKGEAAATLLVEDLRGLLDRAEAPVAEGRA